MKQSWWRRSEYRRGGHRGIGREKMRDVERANEVWKQCRPEKRIVGTTGVDAEARKLSKMPTDLVILYHNS
jgi:hypothetical protein